MVSDLQKSKRGLLVALLITFLVFAGYLSYHSFIRENSVIETTPQSNFGTIKELQFGDTFIYPDYVSISLEESEDALLLSVSNDSLQPLEGDKITVYYLSKEGQQEKSLSGNVVPDESNTFTIETQGRNSQSSVVISIDSDNKGDTLWRR